MGYYEYIRSLDVESEDYPYYSLIMAAMRKADTLNAHKLRTCWPEVWNEVQARYDAPGGYLPGEQPEPVQS